VDESRLLPETPETLAKRMELRKRSLIKQRQNSQQALQADPERNWLYGSNGEGTSEEQGSSLSSTSAGSGATSMAEVLDNMLYLEDEARHELEEEWGDEKTCTHGQGYIAQPVYACRDCSQKAGTRVRYWVAYYFINT
jgi:hypothetical protein